MTVPAEQPSTPATANWPAKPEVTGCSAQSIATLMIRAGALDADYPGDGEDRSPEDDAFWERVHREAHRIASWTVDGLGITGRAKDAAS